MSLDSRRFRDTLGLFATGVAVIATERDEQVHAMTANAVSSVSLDPMLVLFCPGKKTRFAQHLDGIRGFSINFLREEQLALSTYFAGAWQADSPPPFRFVPASGAPRLEGSLASMGCETHAVLDTGDHWLVIGRVIALHQGVPPLKPLLFYRGKYASLGREPVAPAPDLLEADEPAHIFYDF